MPSIIVFVHDLGQILYDIDIHSVFVTGVQQCLGGWIVCGANSVEAVCFQNTYPARLTFGIGSRAEDTAVVMDAAAAQQRLLAVDEQVLARPCDLTNAEGDLPFISRSRCDLRDIEMRILIASELRVRDRQFKACPFADYAVHFCLDRDGRLNSDHCRGNGNGGDFHALGTQAVLFTNVQPNRTVDTRTGVLAGVGQLRVVCHHGQSVFGSNVQPLQFYEKAGIAVGMEAELFAVQGNAGVFIHALKFHKDGFAFPLLRSGEGLFIGVDAAGEIGMSAVGDVRTAAFGNLCIMGQCHCLAVADPVVYEGNLFHV